MTKERKEAKGLRDGEARFAAYLDGITAVLGHASRAASAQAYCTGLLLPGERKSVEPMAARIAPDRVQAQHQSMHHVVANAAWDDATMLTTVRQRVLPAIERHGPVRYWIVDDTAFPKQGWHSVGVARQYCGQLGKQDNCQVAVSLSVANDHASLPIAYRLYLPGLEHCSKRGGGPGAARQGRRARDDRLRDQDGHRTRATPAGARGGRASGHRAGRCRLWRRVRFPGWGQ